MALQLLPPNSCGGLVVITDGVINIPDVNTLDTLLNQLRTKTISLSFIQVRLGIPQMFGKLERVDRMWCGNLLFVIK